MAGGTHLDRLLKETWVYDCTKRRWHRRAPAPEAVEWPGMCYDSRRRWIVYVAPGGTYAYDAAKDAWMRTADGLPQKAWRKYCDMAYDKAHDLYVLNVAGDAYSVNEVTWVMRPEEKGILLETKAYQQEEPEDEAFPPAPDPAVLQRLKEMPPNTWLRANPGFETIGRSWSTMSYDPLLRCVIYQGGGHGGTMNNTVSAYFAEANRWVNAFPGQYPPQIFGAWSDAAAMPAFERGMVCAFHARWYESYGGRMVYGGQSGFEWATRERPIRNDGRVVAQALNISPGPRCLHPEKPLLIGLGKGTGSSDPFNATSLYVTDLVSGEEKQYRLSGEVPKVNCEWSGLAVCSARNVLVLHGAGDSRKGQDTETWMVDLAEPTVWRKLEITGQAPRCGMGKLNPVPGTDLLVLASPHYDDIWVLSLDRKAWKVLGTTYAEGVLKRKFELYGQCVYDWHNQVFVRKWDYDSPTLWLKPDFSRIEW